ncbi:MAG: SdiA-regulated domain-containing protein [Myxococcales bacterium]|nr:SdiA-regulated domain-containing protein [Myxococcales bacterium]
MSLFRFVTRHKSGHLDFEDLALLGGPSAAREFLAVSESSGPAVLRLQVGADGRVRILGWRELVVPVPSYKNSGNRGLEGLALDAEGGVLYAGLEESKDRTGYLLAYPWPMELDPPEHFDEGRMPVEPLWTKRIHDQRWGEPGPLSGLALSRRGGEATLWAVQASTQRLLRLGGRGEPKGCWTLDLRAPDGAAYEVPMPEGVTVDEDHGRLWLVTDPDEKKYRPAGWFRRAKGLYKQGVPMLYEIPIPAAPAPATEVATSARGGA